MLLISIIIILLFLIIFLVYKLYSFSLVILRIEDSLEDCLDILNEKYINVNKILEKEVFFDSVEVRQVISEIKESRDAIIDVANKLTENVTMEKIDEIQEKDS